MQTLAKEAGVSLSTLRRWREGTTTPSHEKRVRLKDALEKLMGAKPEASHASVTREWREIPSPHNAAEVKNVIRVTGKGVVAALGKMLHVDAPRTALGKTTEQEFATYLAIIERAIPVRLEYAKGRVNISGDPRPVDVARTMLEDLIEILGRGEWFDSERLHQEIELRKGEFAPDPPDDSVQGPGPILRPTTQGFEIHPRPLSESERADPNQQSLYRQLQRRVERLRSAMVGLSNTHSMLVEEFNDYAALVSGDMAYADIAAVWTAGAALSDFVQALDAPDTDRMTPRLEPEISAALHALIRESTVFAGGFTIAHELLERVARQQESGESAEDLGSASDAVLRPMLKHPHLLAEKARHLVSALTRAMGAAQSTTRSLAVGSSETARNAVYAYVRALHPIIRAGAIVDITAALTGSEQGPILLAAIGFFRENPDAIAAFMASVPQMNMLVSWILENVRNMPKE